MNAARVIRAHAARAAQLPPVHPGEVLLAELDELGVTPRRFAESAGLPLGQVNDLLTGRASIDGEVALAIATYTGTSATLWLRMQARFDEVR